MLFHTLEFLCFFMIVYSVYCLRPSSNTWLLIASYVFYGYWNYYYLILLWSATLIDYVCSIRIDSSDKPRERKFYLLVSIISNLSILGFFKYANFFMDNLRTVIHFLDWSWDIPFIKIILPVGISFYTFQSLSYVVDVYRREVKPARKLRDFALYVAFFPQLI